MVATAPPPPPRKKEVVHRAEDNGWVRAARRFAGRYRTGAVSQSAGAVRGVYGVGGVSYE